MYMISEGGVNCLGIPTDNHISDGQQEYQLLHSRRMQQTVQAVRNGQISRGGNCGSNQAITVVITCVTAVQGLRDREDRRDFRVFRGRRVRVGLSRAERASGRDRSAGPVGQQARRGLCRGQEVFRAPSAGTCRVTGVQVRRV